jgi:ABC-2 type transport system ATP-binding protein
MKRRLNLIAALIHNPKILILDEPTSGVDVQSRSMIIDYLKSYARQGNTVLYTSHLLDEAQQLCSYIGIIDHGRMVIQGQPEQLISDLGNSSRLDDLFIHYTGHQVRD